MVLALAPVRRLRSVLALTLPPLRRAGAAVAQRRVLRVDAVSPIVKAQRRAFLRSQKRAPVRRLLRAESRTFRRRIGRIARRAAARRAQSPVRRVLRVFGG